MTGPLLIMAAAMFAGHAIIWAHLPKAIAGQAAGISHGALLLGVLPVSLVTTAACALGGTVYLPGGEDRPGHRSSQILQWRLPE